MPGVGVHILQAMPEAFQPGWLQRTWSGTHGSAAMAAHVDETESVLVIQPNGLSGQFRGTGSVHAGSAKIGTFERVGSLSLSGRMSVHHDYLMIQPKHQGTGFARSFNEDAFRRYADAGVDDVTVLAGDTVGGYAWARQDFELAVERPGERITTLVDAALRKGRITSSEHAKLGARLVRDGIDPAPDALTSVRELAAMPDLGQRVLLGTSWSGMRPIERTRGWWDTIPAATPVEDARRAASYATDRLEVTGNSIDAARRLGARLHPALDPFLAPDHIARRLGALDSTQVGEATTKIRQEADNAAARTGQIESQYELQLGAGDARRSVWVGLEQDDADTLSAFRDPDLPPRERAVLDSALVELGVSPTAIRID